jgi:hypothetical protein
VIAVASSTRTNTVRLPTVAVVFPVIAVLLVVQLTPDETHPNVTIRDELVVAAREILAPIESRYIPGDTERIAKFVALIDAACVDACTVSSRCGVAFTRSTSDSSQYRITRVTRPEIRSSMTGVSTTICGVGAIVSIHAPCP